jgi:DNA-binding CsgD family transcriptional regulator
VAIKAEGYRAMIGVEEIYDAAFDRTRFPALIKQLVHAFGATSGYFTWRDTESGEGFEAEYGNDPVWLQSYVDTYSRHDILRPILQAIPEGQCAPVWPYLQDPAVRESIFYREYLAPHRIVDNLSVNLIKRPGITGLLSLIRVEPAEPFSTGDCDRLSSLLPHLRRAVFIQSHLVRAADHAASVQAFAGANSNSLLLAADRTILEIDSPLAHQLQLRIGDSLADGALGKAVQKAIAQTEPVAIEIADAEGLPLPLLCEARPLQQNRFGDLASGPAPTHAVHVTLLNLPRAIAFDAMAAMFRLTPTELKVLRDAIEHGDLIGIGDRLGMAQATARTHLHRIYDKTQTRSFAGLSNLAHRFGRLTPE